MTRAFEHNEYNTYSRYVQALGDVAKGQTSSFIDFIDSYKVPSVMATSRAKLIYHKEM